ncbi:MAG: DUF721 domain-containing protein [Gammaproteobacteria bacterium]|nr:DUF721 domain-containing protein [Gammaproteobacteria bacterium]
MKTITEIFKKNNSLITKLINKLKDSRDLEIIFRAAIDTNLAKHCHFANYKNSELTVIVTNTSWATRFRYAIPDILKQLRIQPEFKDISRIRYTITPSEIQIPNKKSKPIKLSSNNEILWQETIADLKEKNKIRSQK